MTNTLTRPSVPEEIEQPRRRRSQRQRSGRALRLVIVDSILFSLFVLVVNVPLTGLTIHEWLGIFIAVGFVVHLVQHADWIVTTGRRFMDKTSFQNRMNYLLMILLFAGFSSIIVSGLLISTVALPWLGLEPGGGRFWLWLHLASVVWVVWLTAIHVAMNWRWIVNTADRLIFKRLEKR